MTKVLKFDNAYYKECATSEVSILDDITEIKKKEIAVKTKTLVQDVVYNTVYLFIILLWITAIARTIKYLFSM